MPDRCEELAEYYEGRCYCDRDKNAPCHTCALEEVLRKFKREIRNERTGNKILEMASEGRKEEIIDDERERILRELAAHTDKHDTHLFVRVPDVERIVKGEKDEASPHTNGS